MTAPAKYTFGNLRLRLIKQLSSLVPTDFIMCGIPPPGGGNNLGRVCGT
ncbi:hypothetical protein [Candidatus Vallotia lariciata]|nr:hypothetical protein [Candidatus Vallotia lariciata]